MANSVMNGARAVVSISGTDAATGKQFSRVIGIWSSISFSTQFDVSPVYILGRYSPAELNTTGVEPVSVTCSGFKVVGHGFLKEGAYTNIKDLLNQGELTFEVRDRKTGTKVASITGCLPTGITSGMSSRQLQEGTCSYMGLLMSEDDFEMAEAASATVLP